VSAGQGQAILVNQSANLDRSVTDDGSPNPVTTTWSKISGPVTVTFGNAGFQLATYLVFFAAQLAGFNVAAADCLAGAGRLTASMWPPLISGGNVSVTACSRAVAAPTRGSRRNRKESSRSIRA